MSYISGGGGGYSGQIDPYSKTNYGYMLAVRNGAPGAVTLAKTGQTTSYVTYDDGDFEKGASWPSPRFVDNGNGTVTDSLTGLMWERTPAAGNMYWNSAASWGGNLTLAGYSDWRLANRRELMSLFNREVSDISSWLISEGFSSLYASSYWSSTVSWWDGMNEVQAYYVNLLNGQISVSISSNQQLKLAWAVRGGP
jgi:hypothetical protein